MKAGMGLLLVSVLLLAGCTKTTVIQSRYIIHPETETSRCRYTWQQGDYWEFLAWALLDDVSSAEVLAITSGYMSEVLPSPGSQILIPISEDLEQAAELRMEAARLVRRATEARQTNTQECVDLLRQATETDPSWSVPLTDMAVLLLEDGKTQEALELLNPMCHKSIPAMIMAAVSWRQGDTNAALQHLAEAMTATSPSPEVLAATGIAWAVTGQRERAGSVIRQLLEDPEAPSDLRILVMKYALMLGED